MWCIILPFTAIPIILALSLAHRRAKSFNKLTSLSSPYRASSLRSLCVSLFWQLDVIGLVLLCAMLALVLIPLTIAGGISSRWAHADVIVMLVIGFLLVPAFVGYEMLVARHPVVPFHLLNDRSIIGGLFVAMMLNFAWYMQGEYVPFPPLSTVEINPENSSQLSLYGPSSRLRPIYNLSNPHILPLLLRLSPNLPHPRLRSPSLPLHQTFSNHGDLDLCDGVGVVG